MDGVSEERKEGERSERRESTRGWEEGIAGKEEEKRKSERDRGREKKREGSSAPASCV